MSGDPGLCNSSLADHPGRPSLATAAAQGDIPKSDTLNAAVRDFLICSGNASTNYIVCEIHK